MKSKTINRGWLKKQVSLGKIEAKCNYHYTDDYRYDADVNFQKTDWMPCRMQNRVYENDPVTGFSRLINDDFKTGFINFEDWDFKTKSGGAWQTEDDQKNGVISFIIHSNLSYDLRVKQ